MSIKFRILSSASKAEKEGDMIVRYTGDSEPFNRVTDRDCKQIGVDQQGNPRLKFVTGLDEKSVQFYNWYNEEEKKSVLKQIKDLTPVIQDFYGGKDVIDAENKYFWLDNRSVNRLSISNESIGAFFDTVNPPHALLYLSIISGAFAEIVAPTREVAERSQVPHFLALETDANVDDDEEITRSDAHGALSLLRKEASPEALFILAWCIQYDTNAFGGISRATSFNSLISTHIQYIDGKLVSKKKRNTPKVFLEYVEKWNGTQTRPALYAEAYIKAGEYFNFVHQKEKRYVTADGTVLGNTISEAVTNIMKPRQTADLEKLREQVENKWKE